MSFVAWLIVLQFLLVAGFIVSMALLFFGIVAGLWPTRVIAIDNADESPAAVRTADEPVVGWRIADTIPETITG